MCLNPSYDITSCVSLGKLLNLSEPQVFVPPPPLNNFLKLVPSISEHEGSYSPVASKYQSLKY